MGNTYRDLNPFVGYIITPWNKLGLVQRTVKGSNALKNKSYFQMVNSVHEAFVKVNLCPRSIALLLFQMCNSLKAD